MAAYYNEIDPYAAQWLRNLIAAGHIAPGDVDERSIVDVQASDLAGYVQCHFFAGIGGWSIALRRSLWADNRPVWTGSCPCQPFSSAGKQKGHSDERHLWPHWFRLIRESKPATIFGEQVASAITFGWADEVAHDLEKEGYAFAAAVLPACSVNAPHKRDRYWFVADTQGERKWGEQPNIHQKDGGQNGECLQQSNGSVKGDAANAESRQAKRKSQRGFQPYASDGIIAHSVSIGFKGSIGKTLQWQPKELRELERGFEEFNNGWQISAPKICGVDDGIPRRTPKLRAYGNAIVPQVAAEFIKAYCECRP